MVSIDLKSDCVIITIFFENSLIIDQIIIIVAVKHCLKQANGLIVAFFCDQSAKGLFKCSRPYVGANNLEMTVALSLSILICLV